MSQISRDQKPQNIFLIADHLQKTYKNFVKTFQKFQSPIIQGWVDQQMEKKDLLYKDPLIELNFQFERGKPLQKFVQEGVLSPQIPNIFKIHPYKHQSEAIERICKENKNIIVSTGTGSGKSMCFWIPIVNTCLEMKSKGLDGIKAIVIFPMNALANSQYNNIIERLRGTGLKVGRYIGDTPYSREEADRVIEKNQNRKRYDSELPSREEMRESPPDILITNYVMLDLILTRFEDRKLFPEKYKGYIKYLVLDEIHTYSGNKGADVACLIRRLKERTYTRGEIRCIGTSATIQDNKKTGGTASIIEYAEMIFGEDFDDSSLIEATYVDWNLSNEKFLSLPPSITVDDSDLEEFDGTFKKIIPLAEKLLGRALETTERTDKGLGELFRLHPTIIFLRNTLKESAKPLNELAKQYNELFRNNETVENCLKELKAAFLVGTLAKITIENQERPLLVPKLHLFFTQGQEIFSCLTKDGPHLNISGDIKCKICKSPSFPLYFCRNCGHEFYSVVISEKKVYPRTFETEEPGKMAYLTPITKQNNSWQTPDQWLSLNGKIRKTYEGALPTRTNYCPKCNIIDSECSCPDKFEVWKIPYPLQLCPSCEIFYTKRKGEYGKIFSFNSTGRSSATDILTINTISLLDKDQRKMIIFTDNRQDTALQGEHLNEFQRRVNFRQILYHSLKYIQSNNLTVSDLEIGKKIFEYLEKNGLTPEYQREIQNEFTSAPPPQREFIEFLTFLALSDIMQSQYFLDLDLEKLGVLKIEYDGLDQLIVHNYITDIPEFNKISENERYDYIRGILDVFRWNGAIRNTVFEDSVNKYENWQKKLKEDILFDINKSHWNRVGFSFESPQNLERVYHKRQRVIFKKISGHNTILINWTKKFFQIKNTDQANYILNKVIEVLEKANFINTFYTNKPTYKLYQIKEGKILFNLREEELYLKCPKCSRTYNFKIFKSCIWKNCPDLINKTLDPNHYYLKLYQQLPDKESEIHAKEHSAQVEGILREKFENDFQDNSIGTTNVLVCTPTMELGIDIGELSAILMRNVPPDPSRYAQRAGRAGRKNQPSIILVFCGSGYVKGPHDQYFYREPEKIVSGKIEPPNFLLDNKKLTKKHIHAAIIESLEMKIPQKIGDILILNDKDKNYPFAINIKEVLKEIPINYQKLQKTIKNIFTTEIRDFSWFNDEFIHSSINNFYSDLNTNFDNFREEFSATDDELVFIHNQVRAKGRNRLLSRKYDALARKLEQMRNGKQPYNSFGYLSNYGFLPNYGFPSESLHLTMFNPNKTEYHENWRSSVIAIREYAPHNRIYFLGNKYNINKAMIKTDLGEIKEDKVYICPFCNEIIMDTPTTSSISLTECPNCHEEIQLSKFMSSIKFPHMHSRSGPRITCDEENREIKGYEITMNYRHKRANIFSHELTCNNSQIGTITYEHNGEIYVVNKGTLLKAKTTNEKFLRPFNFCSACGEWLHEQEAETHIEKCDKNGSIRNLYKKLWLFIRGNHDVVVFDFPLIGSSDLTPIDISSYYTTLKETIMQSVILTYNLDESEIDGFINPKTGENEMSIVIFETEEGGTGVLKSLLDPSITRFDKFIGNLLNILHIEKLEPYHETMDACETACYNCLLRFRNQFEHKYLNRKVILLLIKRLRNCTLTKVTTVNDRDNNEKLKSLKEKCDSKLEKMVLDEIYREKLPLPDNVIKTIYDNDIPIVQADFFYKPSTCVFIDGPPHAADNIQRQDQEKRNWLESHGYTVVVLDFKDGKYIDDPSLIEKEKLKLRDYLD